MGCDEVFVPGVVTRDSLRELMHRVWFSDRLLYALQFISVYMQAFTWGPSKAVVVSPVSALRPMPYYAIGSATLLIPCRELPCLLLWP